MAGERHNLVTGSIARPVTVLMATLAVVLFGAIALDRLGLNLLPELTYPTLTIRTAVSYTHLTLPTISSV